MLIRQATVTDLPAVEALLRSASLPTDGVAGAIDGFVVAEDRGHLSGVAGLEIRGETALLRSLAVMPSARGTGLGHRLVARLLDEARRRGLSSLWLLTETAERFFAGIGFRPVHREQVPAVLRATAEFSHLCPDSATVMARRVAPLGLLVICTANSARSQIAEALLRHRGGDLVRVASAGTAPGPGPHPLAIAALARLGIDWRDRRSKGIDEVDGTWEIVITVCDGAREACPVLPGRRMVHWGLPDPAAAAGSDAERLAAFEATAAELDGRIASLLSLPLAALTDAEVAEAMAG